MVGNGGNGLNNTDSGVRPSLAGVLRDEFTADFLRELAGDIKAATKGVWVDVECRECGCKQKAKAEIRDLPKIVAMTRDMLEQAEGKPGTQSVEDQGVQLVVQRSWPQSDSQTQT
jgi:hypothetical protein